MHGESKGRTLPTFEDLQQAITYTTEADSLDRWSDDHQIGKFLTSRAVPNLHDLNQTRCELDVETCTLLGVSTEIPTCCS